MFVCLALVACAAAPSQAGAATPSGILALPQAGRVSVSLSHWTKVSRRAGKPRLRLRARVSRGVLVLGALHRHGAGAEVALAAIRPRATSPARAARTARLRFGLGRGWRVGAQRRARFDPAQTPSSTACSQLSDGALAWVGARPPSRRLDRSADGPALNGFAERILLGQAVAAACRAKPGSSLAAYAAGKLAPRPCPGPSQAIGFGAWMYTAAPGEYGIVFQTDACGARHGLLKADDPLTPVPTGSPCSVGESTDLPAGYSCSVDAQGFARFDASPAAPALERGHNYRMVVRYNPAASPLPQYDASNHDALTLRLFGASVDQAGLLGTIPISVTP